VKQEFANAASSQWVLPDGTFVSMFWIVFSVEHSYWPHRSVPML
jgi:hypothetical protein